MLIPIKKKKKDKRRGGKIKNERAHFLSTLQNSSKPITLSSSWSNSFIQYFRSSSKASPCSLLMESPRSSALSSPALQARLSDSTRSPMINSGKGQGWEAQAACPCYSQQSRSR